jgi:hypothetical protein
MDKEREKVYGIGALFIVFCIILSVFTGNQLISMGWGYSSAIFLVISGTCGVFGVGSLLKPDSFGAVILRLIESYGEGQEKSDSHNKQIQKETSGSVQVMGDRPNININVPETKKKQVLKSSTTAKTFSCPRGHGNTVCPPDDNHPKASLEKDHAEKSASGTVIPIEYTCEKEGCGTEFTLYWYKEKIAAYLG